MAFGKHPIVLKCLFLLSIYLLHGRPFVGFIDYGYALLAVYLLLWGIPRTRVHIPFSIIGLTLLAGLHFIPQLAIVEYQRILLDDKKNILSPEEFIKNPSQFPFVLSADGYVQGTNNRRIVSTIDIDQGIKSLRSGWKNRPEYNFYPDVSSLDREKLPFVVCYKITPAMVGSSISVDGTIMMEHNRHFTPLDSKKALIKVDDHTVGSTLCGFGGKWNESGVQNLHISLEKTYKQMAYDSLRILCMFIGFGFLFLGNFLIPRTRDFGIQTGLLILSASSFLLQHSKGLRWSILAQGGNDGIIHDGYAQMMLEKWALGDWKAALMSPEQVFYFMPGMRYVRFLEMLLFGDAYVFQVCLVILMPIILYRFFSNFLTRTVSLTLVLLSFLSIFNALGLSYKLYINSFLNLYGEGVAYALMFISLILLTKKISTIGRGFIPFLLIAVTLSIRPNLGVFMGVICFIHLFSRTFSPLSWKCRLIMLFGLAPGLLIPVHNILGGEFILLTKASQIPENLPLTPALYFQVLCGLIGLTDAHDNIHRLSMHFKQFYPQYVLAWLGCLWMSFKGQTPILRSLALATAAGISVHFFYLPHTRYIHPYLTIAIVLGLYQVQRFRAPSSYTS